MPRLLLGALALLVAGHGSGFPPRQRDCEPAQPARVWSTIVPASVKTRVEPSGQNLFTFNAQGTVVLDVWIDERGEVVCVKVVRSIPVFDTATVEAVRQWKFSPATLGGRPVAVVQTVSVGMPPRLPARGRP